MTERFYVAFRREAHGGLETWIEDFATMDDARESAESVVDDQEADSARLTARGSDMDEIYANGQWTAFS